MKYRKKPVVVDAVQYMILKFQLSMPSNNSWNGKWSGEDNLHVIFRTTRKTFDGQQLAVDILDKGRFSYSFGDGWVASVHATESDPREKRKLTRKSKGFCGYDWMVDEIMSIGRIRTLAEHALATTQ